MNPSKGWRWLRVGEVIRRGDQLFSPFTHEWTPVITTIGDRVKFQEHIRRRVPAKPSRKPGDADKLLKQHALLSHSRAVADLYQD